MTATSYALNELPLLGSNQDSPDPESVEAYPIEGLPSADSRGNTPEARPKHHENPHDFPHTGQPRYPVLFWGDLCALEVIYGLVDPREPTRIRYVGKSCNPASRLASHIGEGYRNARDGKRAWIGRIVWEGYYPNMVLLEVVGRGSKGRELDWYSRLRAVGQADLNASVPSDAVDFEPYRIAPVMLKPRAAVVVGNALARLDGKTRLERIAAKCRAYIARQERVQASLSSSADPSNEGGFKTLIGGGA